MRDIDLMSPEKVASQYGGDKRKIAQAVQNGIINPTVGLMAGMFIDRMRAAAAKEQQPSATVAEEVFTRPQAGLDAARAAPPVERGLDALPVPEDAVPSYESGGIVAFQDTGFVDPRMSRMTEEELAAFNETGQFPDRLKATTGADMRRYDPAEMALRSAPATTPPVMPRQETPPETGLGALPKRRSVAELVGDARSMAEQIVGGAKDKVPTQDEAIGQFEGLLSKVGFDSQVYKKQQEQLAKEREGLKEDRKMAQNMRLLEAGLGIMAGRSPYAFVNIGAGATPAVKGLASDIKEIQKTQREYDKAVRDLDVKQNDLAMGKATGSQAIIDKAQKRVDDKENKLSDLQGRLANTMLSGEIQKEVQKMGGSEFDRKYQLYLQTLKPGEKPSPEGFTRAFAPTGGRGVFTIEDALNLVYKSDPYISAPEAVQKAREMLGAVNAPAPQAAGPKVMSRADVAATARASNRTEQEVIDAAKSRGFTIQ
jgi:hypothetical protein